MMINLFSSFDPSTSFNLSMNWIILLIIMLIFPNNYYVLNNMWNYLFKSMMVSLSNEFSMIMSNKLVQGSMNIIMSIFFLVMMSNSLGLFPWIFTSTSHLLITMMMAFSMWFSFFLFSIINNIKMFLSHLVPSGTPSGLMIFMVIIESISTIIRPITLSVRLSANMIAGHLLMTLMGDSFLSMNVCNYLTLYICQMGLITLELAVAMIQAYVFAMLMILYSLEV